jgi:ribonuclease HI
MQLAEHKKVQLIWVLHHEGIDGNEISTQLAKEGSEHPFIGPEPASGVSIGVPKNVFIDWTIKDHRKQCDSFSGLKQASANKVKELLK